MFKVHINFNDDTCKEFMCSEIVFKNDGLAFFTISNDFYKFDYSEVFSVCVYKGCIVKPKQEEVIQLEI